MASKLSLCTFIIFLLAFLSQTAPTSQLVMVDDFNDCFTMYYRSSTSVTVVAFERVAKALKQYSERRQIMTAFLERNLHTVAPRCTDFVFFVDRRNKFTIFDNNNNNNNNTITLFVPFDEKIRFDERIVLGNQIVMSKVDKEDFESGSLSKGSELSVCNRHTREKLVVSDVSDDKGRVSIQGVNVTQWNIYNDGHVIVHGTDDFFLLGGIREYHDRINTDEFEVL